MAHHRNVSLAGALWQQSARFTPDAHEPAGERLASRVAFVVPSVRMETLRSFTLLLRKWLSGPAALYLLAAALGVTSVVLAISSLVVARRLNSHVESAAAVQSELLSREFAETVRLVTDAAQARIYDRLQDGGAAWSNDLPARVKASLDSAAACICGTVLPSTGATFAWRSDRPEQLLSQGIEPIPADALRRRLRNIALTFVNERSQAMLIKADEDGNEVMVSAFFRARGPVVQVLGYVSDATILADSVLIPVARLTSEARFGSAANDIVGWRIVRPAGMTLFSLGAFDPSSRFLSSAFFRPRFQADSTLETNESTPDPRRSPYRLHVQVHAKPLAQYLYGAGMSPTLPTGILLTLALLLTAATVGLARRFVRHVQERETFATAVAHDLRTPLTQILLYGESLQLARPAVHTREEAARVIVRETRRLIHMVENALQFVSGGRAQPTLRLEPVPLGQLVRESLTGMQPILARSGIAVQTTGVSDVDVLADREAIAQILTNLLDNAVRFGPAGQTLSLNLSASNGHAELCVDDEGPGIPAALREDVFKPFVRGGHSPGAGIGLAVSRQLAELMDGALGASEAPSGGARLTLRVPLARNGKG